MVQRRSSILLRGNFHIAYALKWLILVSMMIDEDIDDIIKKGEDKTAELNSKYAGLDLDALNNFKSESMVNTWEGEDFAGARVRYCISFAKIANCKDSERTSSGSSLPSESERGITLSISITGTT